VLAKPPSANGLLGFAIGLLRPISTVNGMTGVPQANAAQAPSPNHLANRAATIQKVPTGAEREFINGIYRDIVPDVKNAGTLIAT